MLPFSKVLASSFTHAFKAHTKFRVFYMEPKQRKKWESDCMCSRGSYIELEKVWYSIQKPL